jgi:alpha-galactosidase
MEKENGNFNQERYIITEDGRKIDDKLIDEISIGGSWTPKKPRRINIPDVNSAELVRGKPLKEQVKKPRTEIPEIIYNTWMGAEKKVDYSYVKKQVEAFDKLDIHPTSFFIDAGWATKPGDWLSINKQKFPDGFERATKLLKEHNLKPGLWIAPLHVDKNSELAKDHPDWFMENNDKPILYWIKNTAFGGRHYLLNLRKEEVVDYLGEVAQKIKDWGFEWIKSDFMSSLYLVKSISQEEKQYLTHKTMEIFKEKGLKILACGAPWNASIGVADIIRISRDSGMPERPDNIFGKLVNKYFVKNHLKGVKENIRLVGKFIKTDPDMYFSTSVFEGDKQRLKEAQLKSIYRYSCLTLGDDFSKLAVKDTQTIKELINQFWRAQEVRPKAIKMFMAGQTNQKS